MSPGGNWAIAPCMENAVQAGSPIAPTRIVTAATLAGSISSADQAKRTTARRRPWLRESDLSGTLHLGFR
ncbi:MAG: hypothetical protein BWZ07_02914 [Alphaproteobacteria bacterium ADurb.BinA280]|nr:MAG: hypothetical protein BWZ07_02914 [Alphaproteobacteria bacterium ADurb.BinA280]